MNASDTIFSVGSPVDQLDSEQTPKEPTPLSESSFQKKSGLLRKLHPLLQARAAADKVYSNGFFQRHYPKAEKHLKRMLHERVMDAWARSLGSEEDETAPKPKGLGNGGITIQIHVEG